MICQFVRTVVICHRVKLSNDVISFFFVSLAILEFLNLEISHVVKGVFRRFVIVLFDY